LRGSIRRRGKNPRKWQLRFDMVRADGSRKMHEEAFEGTEEEAQARLRRYLTEVDEGRYIAGKETVAEFLTFWLARVKAKAANPDVDCAPNTWRTYERHCRVHIIPALGDKPMKKLGVLDVEMAIDQWRKADLSKASIFNVFTTLRAALNQAVKWDRLRVNPCLKIDKPKKGNSQISPLVLEDFAKFVVALNEKNLFVPALFLALTAVRRNEMLGTYKDDVDLAEGTVFIERQQMRDLETNAIGVGPTKTGRRPIVPLPPELITALADHMTKTRGKLLFPKPGTTEPWLDTTFSSLLRDAAKGVGVTASSQRLRRVFSTTGRKSGVAQLGPGQSPGQQRTREPCPTTTTWTPRTFGLHRQP